MDRLGYGVMYLGEAMADMNSPGLAEKIELDYGLEGEKNYNPEITKNLGIPFLSYDSWNVSGFGPQGSFEVVREDIGTVHPTRTKHTYSRNNISPELRIPTVKPEIFSAGWSFLLDPKGKNYSYLIGNRSAGNSTREGISAFAANNSIYEGRSDGRK
jgi:hypothetical protein